MLSNNSRIQSGAIELMCNLVQHPSGIELFANGSPEAARRVHIMLALAGSETLATRKAAAGSLATLTEIAEVIDTINKQERGIELLLAILEDEEEEMLHRGNVSVLHICHNDTKAAKVAMAKMQELNVKSKLRLAKENAKTKEIIDMFGQADQAI